MRPRPSLATLLGVRFRHWKARGVHSKSPSFHFRGPFFSEPEPGSPLGACKLVESCNPQHQACSQCEQACMQTISYCLKQGGLHAEARHIQLLQDCADQCALSVKFMVRESDFQSRSCMLCAEICISCAADCEKMKEDEVMKNCADVCRRCAESCRKMAAR
jgi:hypothetical protein